MSSNGDAKSAAETKIEQPDLAAKIASTAEKTAKNEESKDTKLNGENGKSLDTNSGESEKQNKDAKENG